MNCSHVNVVCSSCYVNTRTAMYVIIANAIVLLLAVLVLQQRASFVLLRRTVRLIGEFDRIEIPHLHRGFENGTDFSVFLSDYSGESI